MNNENKYYIYAWYYINTNEIFYIGKGSNNRYIDTKRSRNKYFKNIIQKEGNNVNVKKLYENLNEEESYRLERELIHEYLEKGECKANFHEGGCGGNHGNYGENMRRKLSEFASTRTGSKNPMWKHKYTTEQLEKMSVSQKKLLLRRINGHIQIDILKYVQKMLKGLILIQNMKNIELNVKKFGQIMLNNRKHQNKYNIIEIDNVLIIIFVN